MPACARFGPGLHARPLLGVSRGQLAAYARAHALAWVEDPSNQDQRLARNRLRHDVMPRLREAWPEAVQTIVRSARNCADAAELLDTLGAADLGSCKGRYPESLGLPALQGLTAARRRNLLRVWFNSRGLPLPTAAHLERIESEVITAAADATPLLAWPGVEVRRYRDQLFATPPLPALPSAAPRPWQFDAPLDLAPGCGRLEAEAAITGLRAPQPGEAVQVRFSGGGERIRLHGGHRQSLKHLQQQAGIPPWVRRRLPLICYGDEIAAVADLWICEGFRSPAGRPGYAIRWSGAPPGHPSSRRAG
jgi:tRNA(Ile)-lysidine synthase